MRCGLGLGVGDVVLCDRAGAIFEGRGKHMDASKSEIAAITNRDRRQGSLADAIVGSDVFIGLSAPGTLTPEMVRSMAPVPRSVSNPSCPVSPSRLSAPMFTHANAAKSTPPTATMRADESRPGNRTWARSPAQSSNTKGAT